MLHSMLRRLCPSQDAASDSTTTEKKKSVFEELKEKRKTKRWRNGLLSQKWERGDGAPPLDHVPDSEVDWKDTTNFGTAKAKKKRAKEGGTLPV